ncbi:MAG: hypothetical protein SFW65_06195 [Alphaproteobacteria bacterium]|nr:hypothetical protein [Alphaproteobacteria bacterium]
MSTLPQWRMYRHNEPREVPPAYVPPPPPPEEQPNLLQRVWNGTRDFIQSIPGRIRSAAEWIGERFNELRQFFSPKPGVNLNGVDKRLIHVACAIGIGSHTNCVCTDAQRSRNAGYGAANSEHHRGNAMDLRLTSVPGRTDKEKEQFVADVATVLGYGGRREQDRIYASVHGGTGPHLHFQFGSNNIAHLNPVPSTRGGQADLIAAQQRISRLVGPEGLQRIMNTRAPDDVQHNGVPLANSYSGYRQEPRPTTPTLVYSNGPRPQPQLTHEAPRPVLQPRQQAEPQWMMRRHNA